MNFINHVHLSLLLYNDDPFLHNREGDLRVIRPFVNVREKALRDFAETRGLPVIPDNCPACFQAPTERQRVKQLLAQQEILFPKLYDSIRSAIHPLMAINKTGLESTTRSSKKKAGDTTDKSGETIGGDSSD